MSIAGLLWFVVPSALSFSTTTTMLVFCDDDDDDDDDDTARRTTKRQSTRQQQLSNNNATIRRRRRRAVVVVPVKAKAKAKAQQQPESSSSALSSQERRIACRKSSDPPLRMRGASASSDQNTRPTASRAVAPPKMRPDDKAWPLPTEDAALLCRGGCPSPPTSSSSSLGFFDSPRSLATPKKDLSFDDRPIRVTPPRSIDEDLDTAKQRWFPAPGAARRRLVRRYGLEPPPDVVEDLVSTASSSFLLDDDDDLSAFEADLRLHVTNRRRDDDVPQNDISFVHRGTAA